MSGGRLGYKDQAERTPHPQWVRVVGGWSEFQFAERRMPTLEEINAAAPMGEDGKPRFRVSVNDLLIKALALSADAVVPLALTAAGIAGFGLSAHQHLKRAWARPIAEPLQARVGPG